MDKERFLQIRDYFEAALQHDQATREAFVRELCKGDEALFDEVEQLLEAGERSKVFLDGQAADLSMSLPSENSVPKLTNGTILGNRFEILEPLGEGGMGAVYKARDREGALVGGEGIVAIKVILPELTSRDDSLRRFRQEAFLARKIGHRNVVRIFDFAKDGDRAFLTMEFIAGRDLCTVLKEHGPCSPDEASRLALQIARGLEAAHSANVIHRDLKTRNIMVEAGTNRVVITDFGLARPLNLGDATKSVAILGTPSYMAPEQLLDKELDQRSDLFSLGIIIFELVTGKLPFGSDYPSRIRYMQEHRGDVTQFRQDLPAALCPVILKCIHPDLAKRYQTAAELVADLEADQLVKRRVRTEKAVVLWAFALVIVLVVGVVIAWAIRTPPPPRSPISVLIADFENSTGDPVLSGGTIESVLSIALERDPFITSYNRGQALQTARTLGLSESLTEQTAHAIAVREGILDVVAGSIRRTGREFEIEIHVAEAGSPKSIVSRHAQAGSREDALSAVGRVAAALRKALGDSNPAREKPETFTSASVLAIHAYAVAQNLQLEGKGQEAVQEYLHAIELDPDLGRAYSGLAVYFRNLDDTSQARKYYGEALQRIHRMTDREQFRTRGGYYVTIGTPDKAIEEYTELVRKYPADNAGFANLALSLSMKHDMHGAEQQGRRAIAIYPKNVAQRNNEAFYFMFTANFDAAINEAEEALQLNPQFAKAFLVKALSLLAMGHPETAQPVYEQLQTLKDGAANAALGLADMAMYAGLPSQAIESLSRGVKGARAVGHGPDVARKLAAIAEALILTGKTNEAIAAADEALLEDDKHIDTLFQVAQVFVEGGRRDAAARLAKTLGLRSEDDARAYGKEIEGEMRLEGDPAAAIALFLDAQKISDTWIGRMNLGRAYLKNGQYPEADTELEMCWRRRGEATDVFLIDTPTYRYFPSVYYYLGRAQQGLKSPGAADSFRKFLSIKEKAERDPLVDDAKRQLGN